MTNDPKYIPKETYYICALYNFDCETNVLKLPNSIIIKKIPPEFLNFLERQEDESLFPTFFPVKYVALIPRESRINIKRVFDFTEENRIIDLINTTFTVFRLCSRGSFATSDIYYTDIINSKYLISDYIDETLGMKVGPISSPFKADNLFPPPHKAPTHYLHSLDIPNIKILFNFFDKSSRKKTVDRISIAISRFNSSYNGDFEDRLIDQMISFESLFIGDDKELRYKLALRTAFLLGKGRKQIFNDMTDAYNLRGQIVHGNKKVEISKLEIILPKTEKYLRHSIRKFLVLLYKGVSLREIREKLLDENILTNSRTLSLK